MAEPEVFRCGEPKGIAMWSIESHKATPDGFTGVQPVVIIEENEMTIVWGDSLSLLVELRRCGKQSCFIEALNQ